MNWPHNLPFFATGQGLERDLHPCSRCKGQGEEWGSYEYARFTASGYVESIRHGLVECWPCEGRGYFQSFKRIRTRRVRLGHHQAAA